SVKGTSVKVLNALKLRYKFQLFLSLRPTGTSRTIVMCGITGIFYPRSSDTVQVDYLHRMTSVLIHRGPDDGDAYSGGPVGLGHRRLSIIDLAGGKQPIFNEDRTMAIVFNGELYNFQRLRETLLKCGHQFRTSSDTEVILHAYEEYGSQCVRHLRGMFAFAVW